MRNKGKKHLVVFISLILAINANLINNKSINAQNTGNTDYLSLFNIKHQSLIKNQTWLQLSSIWKQWNKVEKKVNNIIHMNFDVVTLTDFNKSKILIEKLFTDKLITNDAKIFLLELFDERYKEIKSTESIMKEMPVCYMPSGKMLAQMNSTKSLEKRYDLLEKLFAENKITRQVYDKSIQQIMKDLTRYRTASDLIASGGGAFNQEMTEFIIEENNGVNKYSESKAENYNYENATNEDTTLEKQKRLEKERKKIEELKKKNAVITQKINNPELMELVILLNK